MTRRMTGISLALMAVVAGLAHFLVIERLVSPGDAERTAAAITAAEPLFRLGIAGLILVVILDVVVAVGLFVLLAPVSRTGSLLAAGFRIAYAAVFLVAISQLVLVLGRLDAPVEALRLIEGFNGLWQIGLVLFAAHLLLVGGLAFRSRFVPRVLGVLLVVAGIGYLVDGLGTVLVPGYAAGVAQFTFVGEVVLIVWLLVAGRRTSAGQPPAAMGGGTDEQSSTRGSVLSSSITPPPGGSRPDVTTDPSRGSISQ